MSYQFSVCGAVPPRTPALLPSIIVCASTLKHTPIILPTPLYDPTPPPSPWKKSCICPSSTKYIKVGSVKFYRFLGTNGAPYALMKTPVARSIVLLLVFYPSTLLVHMSPSSSKGGHRLIFNVIITHS